MNEKERTQPDATVPGYVFNPLNIVFGLWQWGSQNDSLALPAMELFRDAGPGRQSSTVHGFVAWDGITHPQDPASLLSSCAQEDLGVDYLLREAAFESKPQNPSPEPLESRSEVGRRARR